MIILDGNPVSNQTIYKYACRGKHGIFYMTKRGKDTKLAYQLQAKSQWKRQLLTGDIEIKAEYYFGTKRKVDLDNFGKLIFDSLTGIVYKDDSQIKKLTLEKFYCPGDPRIELEIIEL
jgi:Holliday junction resolvase RusA-like endonuclease